MDRKPFSGGNLIKSFCLLSVSFRALFFFVLRTPSGFFFSAQVKRIFQRHRVHWRTELSIGIKLNYRHQKLLLARFSWRTCALTIFACLKWSSSVKRKERRGKTINTMQYALPFHSTIHQIIIEISLSKRLTPFYSHQLFND